RTEDGRASARAYRLLGRRLPRGDGRERDGLRLERLSGESRARTAVGGLPRIARPRLGAVEGDGAALHRRRDLSCLRPGRARVLQRPRRLALCARGGSGLIAVGGGRDRARVRPPRRRQPEQRTVGCARLGPKRWDSSMQVCAETRRGRLSPGAEDPVGYEQNPGEGWAETYRVLNQRRLGLPESQWEIVTQALYPTDAALVAAQQDVTSPWESSSTTRRSGTVTRTSRTRP